MGKGGRKAFIRGFWAERNAEAELDRESEKNGFEKYNKPVLSRSTDLSHVTSLSLYDQAATGPVREWS